MPGRGAWARQPWAAAEPGPSRPGQQLPPPIPGATPYYVQAENGAWPWATRVYAGVGPARLNQPGGIVAVPDPDHGVVRLTAWWPYTSVLHLVRVDADGTRHPVRGAHGIRIDQPTRRNLCPNPSLEVGAHGYLPGAGDPELTVLDADAVAGTRALRATITAAGPVGVVVPTTLATRQDVVTIGFAARLSARPAGMRVTVSWADVDGAALDPSTMELTADEINRSVDQWARHVVVLTPPANAATPTVRLEADALPEGASLDLDAITIEHGPTAGTYFDGAVVGGGWVGTPQLSESILAPVLSLVDGEAPLDLPVRYLVADPSMTGGHATSGVVTLTGDGHAWLTHPDQPATPIPVDLRSAPSLEFGLDQGIFRPLGARRAIVVSALTRQAPTGSIAINATSWAERDRLQALFDDAQPMLLRAPAEFGYGPGAWLALGALTEDREGRTAWQDACLLTATVTEVDPPADLAVDRAVAGGVA